CKLLGSRPQRVKDARSHNPVEQRQVRQMRRTRGRSQGHLASHRRDERWLAHHARAQEPFSPCEAARNGNRIVAANRAGEALERGARKPGAAHERPPPGAKENRAPPELLGTAWRVTEES